MTVNSLPAFAAGEGQRKAPPKRGSIGAAAGEFEKPLPLLRDQAVVVLELIGQRVGDVVIQIPGSLSLPRTSANAPIEWFPTMTQTSMSRVPKSTVSEQAPSRLNCAGSACNGLASRTTMRGS